MDVAGGVVFRQSPCFATKDVHQSQSFATGKPGSVCLKRRPTSKSCDGFVDESHLEYYNGPRMVVKEKDVKKEMKKKLKVLKGLSKNLSTFSEMGFFVNVDSGLDQQLKGQMISEATEVLLSQLQKLKAEKMESKRTKKEEKAKKKAAQMTECKDDSSSSSSSSSESDCENVVNMKQLKTVPTSISHQETTSTTLAVAPVQVHEVENQGALQTVCRDVSNVNVESNKIEVCMGGKCKKSGAAMLLENFQKAVGGEAAVVSCKCMGKCRDGPNVRVRNNEDAVTNPLCIGVGLEDVDSIVANFFGGSQRCCSDMVPAQYIV